VLVLLLSLSLSVPLPYVCVRVDLICYFTQPFEILLGKALVPSVQLEGEDGQEEEAEEYHSNVTAYKM